MVPAGGPVELPAPTTYERMVGGHVFASREEELAAIVGGKVGGKLEAEILLNEARAGMAKQEPLVNWAAQLTGRRTWGALTKVFGPGRAAAISRWLRGIPVIGRAFGVAKSRYHILFDAAESILRMEDGRPKFGTQELIRSDKGEFKITRFTEQQGRDLFNKLRGNEKKAVLAWVKRREHALKFYDVASKQEGYLKRIMEDIAEVGDDPMLLREVTAQERLTRKGKKPYRKDFEKAVVSYEQGLALEREWNRHVNELANLAGREWDAGKAVPKGWVRLPEKIGKVDVVGAGKIMPEKLYRKWVDVAGSGAEMGMAMKIMKGATDAMKTIVLSSVKTLARNVLGGGAQYALYGLDSFFKGGIEMLRGEGRAGLRRMMAPVQGFVESMLPATWDAVPPWALGTGAVGDIAIKSPKLKKVADLMMAAYSSTENFWKRAITVSEMRARGMKLDVHQLTGDLDMAQPMKELYKQIRGVSDAFAFDYNASHSGLKWFRDQPWSAALWMFPIYPVKFTRMTTRLLGGLNPAVAMSGTERAARLLTLATMSWLGYEVYDRKRAGHKLPRLKGFDKYGESNGVRVGQDGESETFWDTKDLPVIGALESIVKGDLLGALDRSVGGVGVPGPAVQAALYMAEPDKMPGRLGTMAGTLGIPGGRMWRDARKVARARDVSMMFAANKEKTGTYSWEQINERKERTPRTAWEGFAEFLPFDTGSRKMGDIVPMKDWKLQALEAGTGIRITKVNRAARSAQWFGALKAEFKEALDAGDKERVKELKEKADEGAAWFNEERHGLQMTKVLGKKVDSDAISAREKKVIASLPKRAQVRVKAVIDGDTFELADGTRVRLRGINTPEIEHKLADRTKKGEHWGEEAKKALEEMLAGKPVYLVGRENDRDARDRRLAYVYVGEGVMVQRELIRAGHGKSLLHYDFIFDKEFAELEEMARKGKLGLFKDGE